jgi:cobalamin biosynthesis Mg chelatase CobN
MSTLKEISVNIGIIGDLSTLDQLKPDYYCDKIDLSSLERVKNEIKERLKKLNLIHDQLKHIYLEKEEDIKSVKEVISLLKTKSEKEPLYKKIEVIKAEKLFISHLQKHIKNLRNSLNSGIGVIDNITINKDSISAFLVRMRFNSHFYVVLYTK